VFVLEIHASNDIVSIFKYTVHLFVYISRKIPKEEYQLTRHPCVDNKSG
jgi:hypothetical protein